MLDAIGVSSIDELFDVIPEAVRLGRSLELPDGKPETEVYDRLSGLAQRNAHAEAETSFLGAGMYDHYVPALVDAIIGRSEFLTPYTPYQPEISQGGLQVMFEFQTAMSELTGLPVSNAAMYEGPSAVASAAYLAIGATGRKKFVASRGVHPHSRESLVTYGAGYGTELVEVPLVDGVTDAAALADAIDDDTAAVFLQQPNFLGGVEDIEPLGAKAKEKGALVVVACDPIALSILRPPGECGADIASGRGPAARQPPRLRRPFLRLLLRDRGAHPPHAGPHRRRDDRRRRPPRLRAHPPDPRAAHPPREGDARHLHRPGAQCAGGDGPSGLARQARLRRARGASGAPHGLRARAAGAGRRRRAAARRSGRPRVRGQPGCTSFERSSIAAPPRASAPGYPLGRDYPEHENGLLVAITERRCWNIDAPRRGARPDAIADLRGSKVAEVAYREQEADQSRTELTQEHPPCSDKAATIFSASIERRTTTTMPEPVEQRPNGTTDPEGPAAPKPAELPEV